MADINQNPSFKSSKGYNGFDMSQDISFTSAVGQLLPIYYDILSPGDKVNLKSTFVTRTQELDSSANQQVTDVVDYFFVPMEQLCSYFGELFYGVFDPNTSNKVIDPSDNLQYPYASLETVNNALLTASDAVNQFEVSDSFRLAGMLGIPLDVYQMVRRGTYVSIDNDYYDRAISLWLPLAYQKIFNDYYRLDDRTAPVVSSFNVDAWVNTDAPITDAGTLQSIFKLHYRPWRKDFFTNLFISPLAGLNAGTDPSILPQNISQFESFLTSVTPNVQTGNTNVRIGNYPNGNTTALINSSISSINTASIRNAFAFEKYIEVTRRAGKDYDSQTLAHFGHKVPRGVTNQVSYLGTHTANLNIGDVISTATTEGSPLGDIAGKGFGYNRNGDAITFEAPIHGVFMAVYSAVPQVTYKANGIDKLNELVERTDFFIPEYDNLGMQPLFMSQLRAIENTTTYTDLNDVLGWQYRYSQFKTKYDKATTGLLGSLSTWLPTKETKAPATAEPFGRWYIPHNYLDEMMLVKYNPDSTTAADMYATDPLMHFFKFDVRKASKMSTYSLPQL